MLQCDDTLTGFLQSPLPLGSFREESSENSAGSLARQIVAKFFGT
jgi:hypothetical protein